MAEGVMKGRAVEVIGVLGVIASLGFVGLEIRQNTTAVRAATIQAVSDQAMELTLAIASDEGLSHLVRRMQRDEVLRADLTPDEAHRLTTLVVAGLRRMENVFLQVEAGILDRGALSRVSTGFYRNPYVRELWQVVRGTFHSGFAEYWDAAIAE